jgi:hypothetical protein
MVVVGSSTAAMNIWADSLASPLQHAVRLPCTQADQEYISLCLLISTHVPGAAPPPPLHLHRGPPGKLKATLERHTGPVFALRWNKRGDLLLTSSADESTVVWDVATSSVRQQFSFHGGEAAPRPRRAGPAVKSRDAHARMRLAGSLCQECVCAQQSRARGCAYSLILYPDCCRSKPKPFHVSSFFISPCLVV